MNAITIPTVAKSESENTILVGSRIPVLGETLLKAPPLCAVCYEVLDVACRDGLPDPWNPGSEKSPFDVAKVSVRAACRLALTALD